MGYKSIAHEAEGLMGFSRRAHEGERNNCFSKIQPVGQKNIDTKHLSLVKATILVFKAGAFRYLLAITNSLLVAQPIRTQY